MEEWARVYERRDQIKERAKAMHLVHEIALNLHQVSDFLESLEQFHTFSKRGVDAIVRCHKGCPEGYAEWVLDLTMRNMKHVHDQSWGWNDAAKQQEIADPGSHFLIAVCDATPIAFVHFRFEENMQDLCLFILDLEVEKDFQARGVGQFLVDACEEIARQIKASSVVTITFLANDDGTSFFRHLGYVPHASSPEVQYPEKAAEYKHRIIYKPVN